MIIYLITNQVNGKRYVGQSVYDDVRKRWYGHVHSSRRPERTNAIAKAIRKYGKDKFTIEVIDHAESLEELNIKEWYFASMLDTYSPLGYNLAECGFNSIRHPETIAKMSKDWVLLSPEGDIVRIHNLHSFCREKGLPFVQMTAVSHNKRFSCHGWRNARRRNRVYHLLNVETGEKKEVIHAWGMTKQAAEQIGILPSRLGDLIRGVVKEHKGWILHGESLSSVAPEFEGQTWKPKKIFRRKHTEATVLKISGGLVKRLLNNTEMKIYEFTNTSRFTTQMNLQIALVINLLKGGKRSKHKRWSLPENPIKRFIVRHKDGRELEIFDGEIKAFCRGQKIGSAQRFFQMLNGELSICKGWTLVKAYTPSSEGLEVIKLKQYDLPN